MDLGHTITKLRKDSNITQEDLAQKCNITQAYLSQIENNKKEPNLSTLKDISTALSVPLPVIFFLSLENEDVPEGKRPIFNAMKPSMAGFFESIFQDERTGNNQP
jgi:transcriptional regulator with XRE-family HTH domain